MKTISLEGIVGFDAMAADIRGALSEANGEDVELIVNSPGGSMVEGIAIYNAIRDYRRQGGRVSARVVGLAGSMSTYIPLAADTVSAEDNAVWMIHEPSMIALGRKSDMEKAASVLEGMSQIIARAYAAKTGTDIEEIRRMMNDETYLFGQEILDAGFVDQMVPAGEGAETKEEAEAIARASVDAMISKLTEKPEEPDELVALAGLEKPVVDGKKTAAKAEKTEEGDMDIDIKSLEKEHPDVFAQAVEIGVQREQKRRKGLNALADSDPDNEKLQEVIRDAIESGVSDHDASLQARVSVAIRDGKSAAGENAPDVATTAQDTASGEEADDDQEEAMIEKTLAEMRKEW